MTDTIRTAVDTNVLLDLVSGDPGAVGAARASLHTALADGVVLVCPIVYAEAAASAQVESIDELLDDLGLVVQAFTSDSLTASAIAWLRYLRQRGSQIQCPLCGRRSDLECPSCGASIVWRQHVIADFLIGAHALRQADQLLTRDAGYYRAYFPDLRLLVPGGSPAD